MPDLKGFAAANGCAGKTDEKIRAALGDKFPKHIYHSIVCIGALIAQREDGCLGAPHVGERPEKELIAAFVERIVVLASQLITFNGSSFDLPVLRYRAMATVLRRRVSRRGLISTATPRMRLIFATYSPRSRLKVRRRCTNYAA